MQELSVTHNETNKNGLVEISEDECPLTWAIAVWIYANDCLVAIKYDVPSPLCELSNSFGASEIAEK